MEIAKMIDHTLLRANATLPEIETLCGEAREYGFFSVCVNPYWITTARKQLEGSDVKVCTVVGFPLGATMANAKADETRHAVEAGADEIDMVMNVGAALEGHWNFIEHEVHEVVSSASGKLVKVILETCLLNEEQIIEASKACKRGKADFVKTSTGFSTGGATVEAVRLMRETVGSEMGVKASGGIRDLAGAKAMVEAGANRLGCSSGVSIVKGETSSSSY